MKTHPSKRIFTAIVPDSPVHNRLLSSMDLLRHSRPWSNQVKWVSSANLHLTLKFAGQLDMTALNQVVTLLKSELKLFGCINLCLYSVSLFPSASKPRLVAADFQKNLSLEALYAIVNDAFYTIGIPKEKRFFRPHITLGRFKKSFTARQTIGTSKRLLLFTDTPGPVCFSARELIVYSSILKSDGPVYSIEKTIDIC